MSAGRALFCPGLAVAALAWALTATAPAAAGYAGGSEAAELELPGSALALVAGSATGGLSRDALAVGENPARIGEAAGGSAAATYALHPGGLSDSQIAIGLARGSAGAFGASLRLVRASFPVALEDGAGAYGGTRGDVTCQTVAGTVGWAPDPSGAAEWFGRAVRAGVSVTYLQREVGGQPASGGGVGGGVVVPCGAGVDAFAVVRNVGWTGPRVWPAAVSAGASIDRADLPLSGGALRASLAGAWSRERGGSAAGGIELGFGRESMGAALRAGYEIGTVRAISPWPSGGLAVRVAGLSVEVGIGSLGGLGLERIVTLSYRETSAEE
ncbi:MAG: hypothetical protein AAB152_14275 [Candidatus Coatesbacteria bacterium]